MDNSKYSIDLTPSQIDNLMDSPNQSNNCINNLCNNNIFPLTGTTDEKKPDDILNRLNKSFRPPGQAIKIVSNSTSHTIVTDTKVGRKLSLDNLDESVYSKTRSLIQYIFIEYKTHAKSDKEVFV